MLAFFPVTRERARQKIQNRRCQRPPQPWQNCLTSREFPTTDFRSRVKVLRLAKFRALKLPGRKSSDRGAKNPLICRRFRFPELLAQVERPRFSVLGPPKSVLPGARGPESRRSRRGLCHRCRPPTRRPGQKVWYFLMVYPLLTRQTPTRALRPVKPGRFCQLLGPRCRGDPGPRPTHGCYSTITCRWVGNGRVMSTPARHGLGPSRSQWRTRLAQPVEEDQDNTQALRVAPVGCRSRHRVSSCPRWP